MTRTNADRAHLARYLSDREPNDPNNLHAIQLGEHTEPSRGRKERKMKKPEHDSKVKNCIVIGGTHNTMVCVQKKCTDDLPICVNGNWMGTKDALQLQSNLKAAIAELTPPRKATQ